MSTQNVSEFIGDVVSEDGLMSLCAHMYHGGRRKPEVGDMSYSYLLSLRCIYVAQRHRLFFFFKCPTLIICTALIQVTY